MFGRETLPTVPANRPRGCPFPSGARVAVLTLLILPWGLPATRALDPEGSDAVEHLAKLVVPAELTARDDPGPRLYQTVYWLWVATRDGLPPENALTMAAQSVRRELSGPCRGQLLADWRVAGDYGLLTPENLERMQDGLRPTATAGPFTGSRIGAARLRPFPGASPNDVTSAAFAPMDHLPSPEALGSGAAPFGPATNGARTMPPVAAWKGLPSGTSGQPPPFRGGPFPPNAGVPNPYAPAPYRPVYPPAPTPAAPVAVEPPAIRPEQVELHDVPFNGSLPLGGTRKLAVASDSGGELSVSVIGDGPKVRIDYENVGTVYYPRVNNSKVPKVNAIHLPGVSGSAYLIHTEATGRYNQATTNYYFIDVAVNNGAAFRIAKVVAYR